MDYPKEIWNEQVIDDTKYNFFPHSKECFFRETDKFNGYIKTSDTNFKYFLLK